MHRSEGERCRSNVSKRAHHPWIAVGLAGWRVCGSGSRSPQAWRGSRETELRLLFQNLIANAIEFRRAEVVPRIEIGGMCTEAGTSFWVSDNGSGIPAERREKVFEIFQRGHARKDVAGCGIGLAHCRKIVELHGGQIRLEESDSGGTRVAIFFPRDGAFATV